MALERFDILTFNKQTKNIMDAVSSLVVVMDEDGRITFINQACTDITGYCFSDVEGRYIWDFLFCPDYAAGARRAFDDLISTHKPCHGKTVWRARDGTSNLISWSSQVIKGAFDDKMSVIATGVGVSQQAVAALGIDGIAHDFNNLLTVIIGNLEILQDYVKAPEGHALIGDAIISAGQGARLIESLCRNNG
ncbi:PAS domain S-box protein [Paremcibacter congregatus]|uniref:PAS domain S-box protein n=1 Tax=Paremcibacter congregatus TaxID=2043170 RepID=UPI0030EB9F06